VLISAADPNDAPERISTLAREIWRAHYVPIVGTEQVEYMLATVESTENIRAQMTAGHAYYVITQEDVLVGYFSVVGEPAQGRMKLNKFYLSASVRGTGLGRHALSFVETLCRAQGLTTLWLLVNKKNPTVTIYERLGFVRTESLVTDIGSGFVMDDYRMEKTVL
jgi:GNAT superfamily N-acetyltransferase